MLFACYFRLLLFEFVLVSFFHKTNEQWIRYIQTHSHGFALRCLYHLCPVLMGRKTSLSLCVLLYFWWNSCYRCCFSRYLCRFLYCCLLFSPSSSSSSFLQPVSIPVTFNAITRTGSITVPTNSAVIALGF